MVQWVKYLPWKCEDACSHSGTHVEAGRGNYICNLHVPTTWWGMQNSQKLTGQLWGDQGQQEKRGPVQMRWKARTKTWSCPQCYNTCAFTYTHECVHTHHSQTHAQKNSNRFHLNAVYLGLKSSVFLAHPMFCTKHMNFVLLIWKTQVIKISLTLKYSHLVAPQGQRTVSKSAYFAHEGCRYEAVGQA